MSDLKRPLQKALCWAANYRVGAFKPRESGVVVSEYEQITELIETAAEVKIDISEQRKKKFESILTVFAIILLLLFVIFYKAAYASYMSLYQGKKVSKSGILSDKSVGSIAFQTTHCFLSFIHVSLVWSGTKQKAINKKWSLASSTETFWYSLDNITDTV